MEMETPVAGSATEQQYVRQGQVLRVSDGQQRALRPERLKTSLGAAVKQEVRGAAVSDDLDTPPQDVLCVTGAERLHRRLLGRKSRREMNCRNPSTLAVGHLAFGE